MKRFQFSFVAVLAVLGACAKLRIDVDVYKGPIANEEQIQIQELIALASGAKPLLVQLRDDLEHTARSISLTEWRSSAGYLDGYMKPMVGSGHLTFLSSQAQSVNEVLGLYGDLGDAEHADRLARIAQLSTRYRYHLRRLNQELPGQKDREREFVDLLKAQGGKVATLLASFFELTGGQRAAVDLVKSMQPPATPPPETPPPAIELRYAPLSGGPLQTLGSQDTVKFGANVAFDILARTDFWKDALGQVAGLEDSKKSEIAANGSAIAQSFLDARQTLRELMRECAKLATDLLATPAPTEQDIRRAHGALVAALTMSSPYILKPGLNPEIALTESEQKRHPALQVVRTKLREYQDQITRALDTRELRDPESRVALVNRVLGWIDPNPAKAISMAAGALLDVDGLAAAGRFRSTEELDKLYDRFGATAGPTSDGTAVPLPEAEVIGTSLTSLHPTGLSGGRPTLGLDRQTTHYLAAISKAGSPDPLLLRELLQSLVQFGEKVRILSGMSPLLGTGPSDLFDILQAVGNSIITQADAIQRSHHLLDDDAELDRHDLEKRTNFAIEQDARALAGSEWPRAPAAMSGGSARSVLDHYARQLSYAHAQELAAHGQSDRAARLAAAHAYIEEEMTKHVFLRHAAAYLRNSYPSPDLQPAPLHLQHGTGTTQIRDPKRRKIAEQLDKQFWQNVNQVTVSGTGDTNMALIKDDIGNWQLKEYSGDTTQIMKSMSALVRFATSAGVSPEALMDAAQLQPLLNKARGGRLRRDEQEKLDTMRKERSKGSAGADSVASAVRVAVRQGAELNAELRAWLEAGDIPDEGLAEIAIPTRPDPNAEAPELAAAVGALHREFLALFELRPKEPTDEQKAKLAEFLARRRDQVRGLQLALLGHDQAPATDAAGK